VTIGRAEASSVAARRPAPVAIEAIAEDETAAETEES
jgi:hypothetical protein